MGVKIIEQDSIGSREHSNARYSNGGAVFIMLFWLFIGIAIGYYGF